MKNHKANEGKKHTKRVWAGKMANHADEMQATAAAERSRCKAAAAAAKNN